MLWSRQFSNSLQTYEPSLPAGFIGFLWRAVPRTLPGAVPGSARSLTSPTHCDTCQAPTWGSARGGAGVEGFLSAPAGPADRQPGAGTAWPAGRRGRAQPGTCAPTPEPPVRRGRGADAGDPPWAEPPGPCTAGLHTWGLPPPGLLAVQSPGTDTLLYTRPPSFHNARHSDPASKQGLWLRPQEQGRPSSPADGPEPLLHP